jgi:hypothetical protein
MPLPAASVGLKLGPDPKDIKVRGIAANGDLRALEGR